MQLDQLVAIDVHTHAEVSCRSTPDDFGQAFDEAAERYFGFSHRPTIAETIAYYRERRLGLVMFTVDAEFETDRRRIPNEEIAEAALENSDMMIAFASIDPHNGKMGLREARRLIEDAQRVPAAYSAAPVKRCLTSSLAATSCRSSRPSISAESLCRKRLATRFEPPPTVCGPRDGRAVLPRTGPGYCLGGGASGNFGRASSIGSH